MIKVNDDVFLRIGVIDGIKEIKGKSRKIKKINLFYDIETYTLLEGIVKPRDLKSWPFSVCVGVVHKNLIYLSIYSTFKELFDDFKEKEVKNIHFNLIGLNNFRYDNHFIYSYLKNCLEYVINTVTKDDLNEYSLNNDGNFPKINIKENVYWEKRIKSASNLDFAFSLNNNKYTTEDMVMKFNLPLSQIGKRLLRKGLIYERYLKLSDFDYKKYNKPLNMSFDEMESYSKYIFEGLNEREKQYIYNDVIILILSYIYFPEINYGFDVKNLTFTSSIVKRYEERDEEFKRQIMMKNNGVHLKYSNFSFDGDNLYNYFKKSYNGGCNFYNFSYIDSIVRNAFSMDRVSSYPSVMMFYKFPKKIRRYTTERGFIEHEGLYIAKVPIKWLNQVINRIQSRVIKESFVKYIKQYDGYVYLLNPHIDFLNMFLKDKIDKLLADNSIYFYEEEFKGKNALEEFYRIKANSKSKYKLIGDITHLKQSSELNDYIDQNEVENAKVCMNGIYGAPALKLYFNQAVYNPVEDNYEIFHNAWENSERNLLFSSFVTAYAFYELYKPLKYIPINKIDDFFIYTDTDSLYLKEEARRYIEENKDEILTDFSINKWAYENDIDSIYIINHKKYSYKTKSGKIVTKSGGIPSDSFDTSYKDFDEFVNKQMFVGREIKTTSFIRNKMGTISSYDKPVVLDKGGRYEIEYSENNNNLHKKIKNELEKMINENPVEYENIYSDGLYIETNKGSFSFNDVISGMFPEKIEANSDIDTFNFWYNVMEG